MASVVGLETRTFYGLRVLKLRPSEQGGNVFPKVEAMTSAAGQNMRIHWRRRASCPRGLNTIFSGRGEPCHSVPEPHQRFLTSADQRCARLWSPALCMVPEGMQLVRNCNRWVATAAKLLAVRGRSRGVGREPPRTFPPRALEPSHCQRIGRGGRANAKSLPAHWSRRSRKSCL